MSQRISPRRRMVEAIAVALAAAPLAVNAANVSSVKPVSRSAAPMLCSGNEAKGSMALQYTPFGWTLAEVGDDPKAACTIKATAANLHVLFPGNGSKTALLESAPTFALSGKQFNFSFVEPVLCSSYYPVSSPDLVALQYTAPGMTAQTLRGVSSLSYSVPVSGNANTGRLAPGMAQGSNGAFVQCYAVPYSTLAAGAADVPAPSVTVTELVFNAGFEDLGSPSQRADLKVEILDGPDGNPSAYLTRNLTKTIAQPFQYSIRVRNTGLAAASNVRLKEYVPTTGPLAPLVTAGAYTCVDRIAGQTMADAGTSCAGGTGVLDAAGFSVPVGGSRTYTLTRSVPTATTGQKSVLATGLFYDPQDTVGQGDVATSDNIAAAVINLIENQAPTISCVNNAGGAAITSPISINEDGAALNFSCTLADAESDPLHPTTPFVATSSNTGLISNASLLGVPVGNVWPLTIQPVADMSGTAVITLTATDNRNAQRQLAITVNVAEVNDAPSYDLFSQGGKKIYRVSLTGTGAMPSIAAADGTLLTTTVTRDANCGSGSACSLRIANVFQNVDAGSMAEITAGQQVQPADTQCDDGLITNYFFTDARSGKVAPSPYNETTGLRPSGSNWDLVLTYDKTAVGSVNMKCNFRFQDNGAPTPATSIDSPSLTEIQFLGFAGS